MRRPIGLTVPYREVGYKEKKEWEIKRPWTGLTLDELIEISKPFEGQLPEGWMKLTSAVEAKLKEKNT